MDNLWHNLLIDALKALTDRTGEPVSGAKLRAAVKKLADDRSLPFPPDGVTKWSTFLASFPSDITVVPNPGSDVLVVPANRPDLHAAATAKAPTVQPVRMRSDMFEALTRIPDAGDCALYIPESDAVLWQKIGETKPPNAVQFATATLEAEIDLRRRFAEDWVSDKGEAKNALLNALASSGSLRNFSHMIRQYGLMQDWHVFRIGAMSGKLRDWAQSNGLTFQDDWLGLGAPKVSTNVDSGASIAAMGGKRGLVELAGLLSDEDISRISVPLDIVLRLLAGR